MTTAPATVLIADDDPVALELLGEVLAFEGHRVRAAAGGEECLRLAAAEPVDLAIVDLRMPGVDGVQVLRRLTSIQPGVPVLILTAFATIDTAIEAIREGAYDYLSKPFRMEEVKLVVRRTLEARRLAGRMPSFAARWSTATARRTWSANLRPWSRSTSWWRAWRRSIRP